MRFYSLPFTFYDPCIPWNSIEFLGFAVRLRHKIGLLRVDSTATSRINGRHLPLTFYGYSGIKKDQHTPAHGSPRKA